MTNVSGLKLTKMNRTPAFYIHQYGSLKNRTFLPLLAFIMSFNFEKAFASLHYVFQLYKQPPY